MTSDRVDGVVRVEVTEMAGRNATLLQHQKRVSNDESTLSL